MKVLIFSHESDLDGLYSAAIGLIRYPQAITIFQGYGVENFNVLGGHIYSSVRLEPTESRGKIIIADLGLNDDLIEFCVKSFSVAMQKGWEIIWVDHHPWSQMALEAISPFAQIIHDDSGKKCAADLMYEALLPSNSLAASLAAMAHTMDFFIKDQYLTPISELIRYYQSFPDFCFKMSDLARKSSRGILWDVQMQRDFNEYVHLRDAAKIQAFTSMQVRHIGKFKIAYVRSDPYLQNSLFSEEVFSTTKADLVMFYSIKGKVSIRRNNSKISCHEIAANLVEGGGHEYAAGARFISNPSKTMEVIAELEAAVAKALASRQADHYSKTLKEY